MLFDLCLRLDLCLRFLEILGTLKPPVNVSLSVKRNEIRSLLDLDKSSFDINDLLISEVIKLLFSSRFSSGFNNFTNVSLNIESVNSPDLFISLYFFNIFS